jgi:hypothetical protein
MVSRFIINHINTQEDWPQSLHQVAVNAASVLHQNWREEYITNNGNIPRMKDTPDGKVDINVPFNRVHPLYQKANLTMATFVIKMLCLFAREHEDVRVYYRLIHDFWLQENPYAENGPLDIPWDDLPKVEQDKDVVVYMVCNEHYTMSLWDLPL